MSIKGWVDGSMLIVILKHEVVHAYVCEEELVTYAVHGVVCLACREAPALSLMEPLSKHEV